LPDLDVILKKRRWRNRPAQRLRGGTGLPTLQRIMASHVTTAAVALGIVAKAFLPDYTNKDVSQEYDGV
jgi:hypothetical protein